jgi:hypothetical protein
MIRIARAKQSPSNLRFELAEAGDLPDSGTFDANCAFNVLHLVNDLPATLARLHRGPMEIPQTVTSKSCGASP